MSSVYLQSMYSESCFSERSRNKQQSLFLLRVSKLASGAECAPRRAVLLRFGPLAGCLLRPLLLTDRHTQTDTHDTQPVTFPASARPSWLSSRVACVHMGFAVIWVALASFIVSRLLCMKGLSCSFHSAWRMDTCISFAEVCGCRLKKCTAVQIPYRHNLHSHTAS